jgi:hypothetical protein
MKTVLSALLLASVIAWTSPLLAAPAQWGIAINSQTKECAAFWEGDEFVRYSLKDGWKDYYPGDSDAGYGIVTEFGRCAFEIHNEKTCCDQLKLTFVTVDWPEQVLRGRDDGGSDRGGGDSRGGDSDGGGGGCGCRIDNAGRHSEHGSLYLFLGLVLGLSLRSRGAMRF